MTALFIMKYILVKRIFTENKYNQSAPEFYMHQGKTTKNTALPIILGTSVIFHYGTKTKKNDAG